MDSEPKSAASSGLAQRASELPGAPLGYRAAPIFAELEPGAEIALDPSGVSVERLRYEEEQSYYNELYLLAPVAYFVLGFDSRILQANLVGAAMLGIVRTAPGQRPFRAFVSAAFVADFDRFISVALNCAEPHHCRLQLQRTDGQTIDVSLHASCDGSGQACRVVVEPAEGKLAALEQSEERFRRIVHSAQEGIWEIDARSCTLFVNPTMAAMLGYHIEDMLGQPLVKFMDDEGRGILEKNIARRQQGVSERHEFKFMHRDGRAVWTTMATNPIFDASAHYMGALALVTDITSTKQSTQLSWQQANFDALTGLPNRHVFIDRLHAEARKADRNAACLALLFIDLDHFKKINDLHGHAMGDLVLVEAARRMASCVRATDTLARLEGDQFSVILSGLDQVGSVERIARSIIAVLALPFELAGQRALLSASIGIALYPADTSGLAELVEHAHQAMTASKNAGPSSFSYYTPAFQEAARARQGIAADLRVAIAEHQFELHYQPIVSLHTGAVHKAEALLRWRHPSRGLLGPAEFIALAETNGLIVEIGDWVFRQAAQQAGKWQQSIDPAFQISVNNSPLQFRRDAGLIEGWISCLDELGLPANSLVIEITERALMDGADKVIERLRQYRAMGMQVALDDFGTGYASLSHLARFDIDFVKIDRSFIATLEHDGGDLALCEAIIAMAHKLGLKVVAEGVETKVQRALLVDAGCDYAQGYMFARPMPAAQFEAIALAAVSKMAH